MDTGGSWGFQETAKSLRKPQEPRETPPAHVAKERQGGPGKPQDAPDGEPDHAKSLVRAKG